MPAVIKIRLGSRCNQSCSWCHSCKENDYVFNPKLIPYIKYSIPDIYKINYGGGEPLLYWDTVKMFLNTFPELEHHIVTNGSLINEEVLKYSKIRKLRIGISLNEYTNLDNSVYKIISEIPNLGIARIYTGDFTFDELDEMLDEFNSHLNNRQICADYNLMHTTINNIKRYTEEQKKHYIEEMDKRIERSLIFMKNDLVSKYDHMVYNLIQIQRIGKRRIYDLRPNGCFHYNFEMVSLDGRFMECPYEEDYAGDIEDLYNLIYPKIKKENCLKCENLFGCTSCEKNTTNDECEMLIGVIKRLKTRLKEFNITPEQYKENLRSRRLWFTDFGYKTDD